MPAAADVVHFTSGRAKTGIVLEETDTQVRLETADGVMGIPWAVIESVDRDTRQKNGRIRRQWAVAQQQATRRRRARRAARQAEEAAQQTEPEITQAEANRRAEAEKRKLATNRARVEKYQRKQGELAEEERDSQALVVPPAQMTKTETAIQVGADVMNVSRNTHQNIAVDVELVETLGPGEERVAARRSVTIRELPPGHIERVEVEFSFLPGFPVRPRVSVASSTPVS